MTYTFIVFHPLTPSKRITSLKESETAPELTKSTGTIDAYAAMELGITLVPHQYTPKPLGLMDVEIKISHCGMCYTDIHMVRNEFGMTSYPIVPGHELVGTVSQKGSLVTGLQIGQRVGVGWQAGADFTCDFCVSGRDHLCDNSEPTCAGREGGYATHVRADARMAYPIPDALPSEYAAPLLCAGITVFSPLIHHQINGSARLGVIGIGGLGHLALQYGKALGCHVTAFSSTSDKEEEALQFGADEFVDTGQSGALASRANTCDFILCTATADLPWAEYISALRSDGKLCIVGVPDSDMKIPALAMIFGQKSVVTSKTGSSSDMKAMLDFSAHHKVYPLIEKYPWRDVNQAMQRLAENKVRYRAVLVMD